MTKGGTIDCIKEAEESSKDSESIDTVVEKNKNIKEISSAIAGQYDSRPIEIKRTPSGIYNNPKPAGTDGAYEHQYHQEQGIKVDYSKLWEHLGAKKSQAQQAEEIVHRQQTQERKGEMQITEMTDFVEGYMIKTLFQSGDRVDYEDKERFVYKAMFPEGKVWLFYKQRDSVWGTGDFNLSLTDFRN